MTSSWFSFFSLSKSFFRAPKTIAAGRHTDAVIVIVTYSVGPSYEKNDRCYFYEDLRMVDRCTDAVVITATCNKTVNLKLKATNNKKRMKVFKNGRSPLFQL
jgi:hypothetical protein